MSAIRSLKECRSCVLVVEHQAMAAEALDQLLRQHGGYEATFSVSAEDALVHMWEVRPALVLIDVSLPGRSGIWLAGQIHRFWPDLPMLMLSGLARPEYVVQSLAAGVRGYVLKDDLPGIVEAIEIALDGGTYIGKAASGGPHPGRR